MKTISLFLALFLWPLALSAQTKAAPGFTDSHVLFYGEVRQVSGAQTLLLQSGQLQLTFVNQNDPTNRVTVGTSLRQTGPDENFSYALKVPLAYLPSPERRDEFLAIGAEETDFRIEEITINDRPATLPDGSVEFYGFSFASRSADHRLDLIVQGEVEDLDGDELPDWWERLHGLDATIDDRASDPDNDGWTNAQEYRLGGNPNLSNREPQLATRFIHVPESGTAGLYLDILDSDSPAAEIKLTLSAVTGAAFSLLLDGEEIDSVTSQEVTLADLQAGRVCLQHLDRSQNTLTLPVSWNDGGTVYQKDLQLFVSSPSMVDGNESALWLDGMDLGVQGDSISSWSDRSGHDRSATQPTAGYRPKVSDRGADFSGSAHLFFSDLVVANGDHTILASYRTAARASESRTLLSLNRGFMKVAPTSQAISYAGAPAYQMDGFAVRGMVNLSGAATTSIFRREADLLQGIYGMSYDGENVSATEIEPVLPTIGARRPAISNGSGPVEESFLGQLHELLVFPSALPEQKLRDVHDYLESKWSDAVIWDFSTELKAISLSGGSGSVPQIIRGGHGDDSLGGGSANDTLSGGPGADLLSGGLGEDRFVFGLIDTGTDTILDFNGEDDVIDLSALFWGESGDARDFVSVRLDTDQSTAIPTLNSVLIVTLPSGELQEIVLKNTVLGSSRLIELIVEGRLLMGALSIPAEVQLSLVDGGAAPGRDESFQVMITRSGDGVAGALEIPIGFFEDLLGGNGSVVIEEAFSNDGQRSTVKLARGERQRLLTVRPVPDVVSTPAGELETAVLPHFKYQVTGQPVLQPVAGDFRVWLEVAEPNAVAELSQPALVRLHRDGELTESLAVSMEYSGTAEEGIHYQSLSESLTIPAGQSFVEFSVVAMSEGLSEGAKVMRVQLSPDDKFQLGNPNEALVYFGQTMAETNQAGLDRWLSASTSGQLNSLQDLMQLPGDERKRYLQAYAYGLDSLELASEPRLAFRIASGKPEISVTNQVRTADVSWQVLASSGLDGWMDESDQFVKTSLAGGSQFTGESLPEIQASRFYQLTNRLDASVITTGRIAALAGTNEFRLSGSAKWEAGVVEGSLTTLGGGIESPNRIVAQTTGRGNLEFEMEVTSGDGSGVLAFYLDGVKQSETAGAAVTTQLDLGNDDTHLLMWEFVRGTGAAGNVSIRNLTK
jgi:hypothetical protein